MEKFDVREIEYHGAFKTYVWGFVLSIILTLAAYFAVVERLFPVYVLLGTIVGLGVIQAVVQLLFFLHLGRESKPDWNALTFSFMALVIVIIVGGTLWIMFNLDERVMPTM